jgi:hypothetical protein
MKAEMMLKCSSRANYSNSQRRTSWAHPEPGRNHHIAQIGSEVVTVVPEPATGMLVGLGVLGLAVKGGRRLSARSPRRGQSRHIPHHATTRLPPRTRGEGRIPDRPSPVTHRPRTPQASQEWRSSIFIAGSSRDRAPTRARPSRSAPRPGARSPSLRAPPSP